MKMIRAIVRPEREDEVVEALQAAGIVSLTKMDVLGCGQQGGVRVGGALYDEIPKVQLLVVVQDAQVDGAVAAIEKGAKTGQHGDGKCFVSPVEASWTIRTGARDAAA